MIWSAVRSRSVEAPTRELSMAGKSKAIVGIPAVPPVAFAAALLAAPGSSGTGAPALPLSGRPPSVGAGKDVLDVIVDQHNVEFAALLAIMPGQLRIGFPLNPVGRLLLAQENEVIELGGMVAISGGPMVTLVDTDSRWTTRPSWSCVTPMIMGIPPSTWGSGSKRSRTCKTDLCCRPWKHPVLRTRLDIPFSGGQVYVIGRSRIEDGNSGYNKRRAYASVSVHGV